MTSRTLASRTLTLAALAGAAGAAPAQTGRQAAAPATAPAPPPAAAPFALEQVLSAPFPSSVTAAPGPAGRFAWVVLDEGTRSVWGAGPAEGGGGLAVRVAHFPRDDGQDLGSLSLSRDGRTVAVVRGQGYNALRENPNPSSDPLGAEQAVWVSVGRAPARRVGAGGSPAVSPDGRWVLFQRDSTLMIAPTSGAAEPRPLFRGRGVNTQARWSPDGRLVAFSSQRGTHAFIGVYDRARATIRWVAPGVDRDQYPRWSPDGRRLAFVRTDGGGGGGNAFAPQAERGFGLWIADAATGAARELWHSPPGVEGRLRIPTAGEHFLWTGGHLVFLLERDGYQHFYSIAADGSEREPTQLTTGQCEAEEPSPGGDGRFIYYSSNCGDIDRKHLWRVPTAGGAPPEQLTSGASIEYGPAVSGDRLLFLRSDARRPPVPVMARLGGANGLREVAVRGAPAPPPDFPSAALVEPRAVTFRAADGTEIRGQLFVPPGGAERGGKLPGVLFMHGGPVRQMLLGWHPRGYYNRAYGFNQYLAGKGYVVLSVNYRGGVGYGRAFREAPNRGRQGASEYQDVVAAGRYLQSLPYVDSARIGLWGGSYGGYLTALGMAKNPELFKAGVDLHGVHDWNARFSSFAPSATAGAREADSVLARGRESSPVCCVRNIRGPILFIHGDDDRNVAFSETVTLVRLMRAENKPFELLVFPDDVHDFLRHANWLAAYRASAEFFDRVLRDAGRTAVR